ncbi:hypothetical protein [Bowmanella denitrificans]|uniref:hypothetical protein n=1 Tax=Bowmanella denitrificans TaxID=366582 RepID=UPI000C9D0BF7|nr:hypothetical protein [Bowmanella denitrificans]
MEVREQYGEEARIQLNFFSFMTVAVWVCFGVSLSFALALHLVITSTLTDASFESTVFWLSTAMYGFIGFVFSLIGSALIYPIYNLWCERMRGQRVRGKFAIVCRDV